MDARDIKTISFGMYVFKHLKDNPDSLKDTKELWGEFTNGELDRCMQCKQPLAFILGTLTCLNKKCKNNPAPPPQDIGGEK